MTEYIDRNEAIAAIREYRGYFQGSPATDNLILKMETENIIADLDSADVAPVRYARWKVNELGFLECTNCAWVRHGIPLVEHYPYCPNCGARMDLGGADNEN